jgi:hypothetical protein
VRISGNVLVVSLMDEMSHCEVATVLGFILASSNKVESEGRQVKQCCIKYIHKK